jgi:ketosteroid isomerase-like protein
MLTAAATVAGAAPAQTPDAALRKEIDALNAAMVAAFKRDPASVAAFYTDDGLIVGGGQRAEGRDAINGYWKSAAMFSGWTLETLETGGSTDAPWQYGRSVVTGTGGRTMETFFLGLLRRQASGELKMSVDAYSRERRSPAPAERQRITDTWLKASRGDAIAVKLIRSNPLALLAPVEAAPATPTSIRQTTSAIVEAVANAVVDRYVFPDVGVKIAADVREREREGAYDTLAGGELADALTRDLRARNGDRHLSVLYQPGQPDQAAGSSTGPVRQAPSDASMDATRRRNYHVNRAERLDGNVGYLELRRFFGQTAEARDAMAGAMAFLAQTDAMIIDVRYAPGGDSRMVDLVASYFFEKPLPTLATYFRPRNETTQRTLLESVPGRRRPNLPVYVLTSRDTGSAAEDFAFLMRQMGRATLVGDRTAGAGHANAIVGIGGGYSVSVSIGRTFDPKTNEGWEGTGVQPHVRAAPADALDTAHRLALSTLIDLAKDQTIRRELSWTREALDARRTPIAVDATILQAYAGHYGVRWIVFEHGRLWYKRSADAERLPLLPLSATDFALAEGQRLQFIVNENSMELRLLAPDGAHVSYARQRT